MIETARAVLHAEELAAASREPAPSAAELQRFVGERLSDYKVPETLSLTTEPQPRNANGKILKRQLRDALRPE